MTLSAYGGKRKLKIKFNVGIQIQILAHSQLQRKNYANLKAGLNV